MSAPIKLRLQLTEGARWGVVVGWASESEPLLEVDADAELCVASVAKLLLLTAWPSAIELGELDPRRPLDRRTVPPVADSGIWQHLDQDALSVHDVATLIGIASDNLATNVLLEALGLDRMREEAADARHRWRTTARPRARRADSRLSGDARHRDRAGTVRADAPHRQRHARWRRQFSARVRGWLTNSVDLSMVASAFHLDPLSHGVSGEAALINKTGTDDGVRADAGFVETAEGALIYCAIANWPPALAITDLVMQDMRSIGSLVRSAR